MTDLADDIAELRTKARCACPWCPKPTAEGAFSLMGQPTCHEHSAEAMLSTLASARSQLGSDEGSEDDGAEAFLATQQGLKE